MTPTSCVFTDLANTMKYGEGSYITLFSPSDVTAFHRMKYGEGGAIQPCFHRVTSLRFTEYYIVPQAFIDYSQNNFQLSWDMMKRNILI